MAKITLNHITKVEGHANLSVEIKNNKLVRCELGSIEGTRFFEGIVVGRRYDEIKEITSRICGICSVSHSMTSLKATEKAFDVKVTKQTEILRELMSIGERIRSHATHLYFLVLPDYLGFESAIPMAKQYQKEVFRALDLVKIGNEIVLKTGGRQMHPISCVVGGFTSVPSKEDCDYLLSELKKSRKKAFDTLELFCKLKYPKVELDMEQISLKPETSQPMLKGAIVSNKGLNVSENKYSDFIDEKIESYSTAKFAVKNGKSYLLGALSRVGNNFECFAVDIKKVISKYKFIFPSKNIFNQNVAQAAELVYWLDEAISILENNEFELQKLVFVSVKAGTGRAATEAPRGILFHEYSFDDSGNVTHCNIMTPTCQNLRGMEEYVHAFIELLLKKKVKKKEIILEIEKLIRAYDPCFSCSTHFLQVDWLQK
ncbi:MAG: Ni/Fe hydrogenase subunit alpha [Nanoarchaeota archaeon]|nr:Ni/Fe hydrogenase subunit alpha [Nanoarchaeota archaeon]MBU1030637.1 Ni/Fe hydrogenase subunit alpha [Nanoarchaeota archaeon]MBU1849361.1 Ni/Fe hydrogenase subunit alpha [Nanoarchaeota archaeon]